MKREDENVRNTVDDFLNRRFGKPPIDKMEAAGERVLHRLAFAASKSAPAVDDAITTADAPGRFWKWRLLAVAAVVVAVFIPAMLLRHIVWPGGEGPAVFETAEGARKIGLGKTIRSNDTTGAVVALPDGSRIEMRSQSELMLERANDGLRIRLLQGSVIITAAKQGSGHLYVQTRDITVSVVGTVFLVNAEEAGSRVAVIEGEVRVQQGTLLKKLLPGEQVSTNPIMQAVPVIEEIQWSRNLLSHLALLQQAVVIPPITPQAPAPPQFDVVSIKPCPPWGSGARGVAGPGGGRGGAGGAGIPVSSPGSLDLPCTPLGVTVETLIRQAYLTFANGERNSQAGIAVSIEGPAWIKTERYEIRAKAEGMPAPEMMRGPMMQAFLEDRFKLKLHRETREVPVYAMTVLRSGLKVQPLEEGSCEPLDTLNPPRRPMRMTPDVFEEILQPGQKPGCGLVGISSWGPGDLNQTVYGKAMGFPQFATVLSRGLDRLVIDRTGVTGIFNLRLRFARDSATAGFLPPLLPGQTPPPEAASEPAGPSIFTAIQEQLGLKLDPGVGPGEFLVIDHVEKPSEN